MRPARGHSGVCRIQAGVLSFFWIQADFRTEHLGPAVVIALTVLSDSEADYGHHNGTANTEKRDTCQRRQPARACLFVGLFWRLREGFGE